MNTQHPHHHIDIERAERLVAVGFCVLVALVTAAVVIANINLF